MGNFINNLLDNLLSTLWRFLDLPMYFICGVLVICLALFSWLLLRFKKNINKKKLYIFNAVVVFILLILIVDKKIRTIQLEMNFLNSKIAEFQMTSQSNTVFQKTDLVYDIQPLKAAFPEAKIYEKPINGAIDLVTFKTIDPNVMCYVAIVDLMYPGVAVKVTPEKKHKYLTSQFAEENNCELAINGEAGLSMAMDCELGEWTGNWISDGHVVLMEDSDKRPFIGFSKNNLAHYSKEILVDTTYDENKYNAIWGRFDILVENNIISHDVDQPYARTVMGVDAKGERLYLMIVDGKRPDYSEGLTYAACAKILSLLGASDAMACDQGGSSCMYMRSMGGIINRPADSDGLERPIYSHFGISVQG